MTRKATRDGPYVHFLFPPFISDDAIVLILGGAVRSASLRPQTREPKLQTRSRARALMTGERRVAAVGHSVGPAADEPADGT
ncbi:hypothetical protein EYF80_020493 [Liparis tanakae]|uniref:Uncharacterized protein n=1 Tax=Liparis tanakae TaxID=230148 RepID=A0A4Z2HWS8_9TELE|nr:hypothetical protein EYF80_020493 [Liparis tanakae]